MSCFQFLKNLWLFLFGRRDVPVFKKRKHIVTLRAPLTVNAGSHILYFDRDVYTIEVGGEIPARGERIGRSRTR